MTAQAAIANGAPKKESKCADERIEAAKEIAQQAADKAVEVAKEVADKGAEVAQAAVKVGKELARAGLAGVKAGVEEAKKAYNENK